MHPRLRSLLKLSAKVAISAVLIFALLISVDLRELIVRAASADRVLLGSAFAVTLILPVINALRWQLIARALARPVSFADAWQLVMIGNFFSQALPSSMGGDVVRVWRLQRAGFGLRAAFNSILLDRLVALSALVILGATGLPWLRTRIGDGTAFLSYVLALFACVVGLVALLAADWFPERLYRWRGLDVIRKLSLDARRLVFGSRLFLPSLACGLFIQIAVAMAVFLLSRAIDSEVSIGNCIALVPPVILVTMIPVSIAGWGVREGAMVFAFSLVGIPQGEALLASLLFGLAVLFSSLPGGVLWFRSSEELQRNWNWADSTEKDGLTKKVSH